MRRGRTTKRARPLLSVRCAIVLMPLPLRTTRTRAAGRPLLRTVAVSVVRRPTRSRRLLGATVRQPAAAAGVVPGVLPGVVPGAGVPGRGVLGLGWRAAHRRRRRGGDLVLRQREVPDPDGVDVAGVRQVAVAAIRAESQALARQPVGDRSGRGARAADLGPVDEQPHRLAVVRPHGVMPRAVPDRACAGLRGDDVARRSRDVEREPAAGSGVEPIRARTAGRRALGDDVAVAPRRRGVADPRVDRQAGRLQAGGVRHEHLVVAVEVQREAVDAEDAMRGRRALPELSVAAGARGVADDRAGTVVQQPLAGEPERGVCRCGRQRQCCD